MALKQAKTLKNLINIAKRNFNSFCLGAFTGEENFLLIKKACLKLNFLNLKSKARHLFFG